MRAKDVRLGGTYAARVSGRVVPVTLTAESVFGGWDGENEETGKRVRVHTAARLHYPMHRDEGGRWVASREVAAGADGCMREVRR